METDIRTTEKISAPRVQHFSVFCENKVGALLDLVKMLSENHVHAVALSVQASSDSAIVRLVVSDPDLVKDLFAREGIAHSHTEVIVVELKEAGADLAKLLATLLMAEVNIDYSYPLLTRPSGRSALIIHPDDDECALSVLMGAGFRILTQGDISR
ncbi:MAG TPA: hypothetical protein VIT91_13585 [Chthoniobacterales bacterium]